MKARILFLVAIFILPNLLLAQNLYSQPTTPLSLHQKQIKRFFNNNSDVGLNGSVNRINFQSDTLRPACDSIERSLYIIRVTGMDSEECLNFYGFSLAGAHSNNLANFYGFCLNMGLGSMRRYETYISVNGLNFSLFGLSTEGTMNGFSFGTLFNSATYSNGILIGAMAGSENLNGIVIGGLMSYSQYANAIQIAGIFNEYCNFNGIGIALINSTTSGFEETMKSYSEDYCTENKVYGIMLGLYNAVDVRGISLALINNGNSWLQIGLLNIGDSVIQIGLVNLDGNKKMGIPIININF